MQERKLICFELGHQGHYPKFIASLAQYWQEQELGQCWFVVSQQFMESHREIPEQLSSNLVTFVPLTDAEESLIRTFGPGQDPTWRDFLQADPGMKFPDAQRWDLLQRYAEKMSASRALILQFDNYQLSVAAGFKSYCPFSGIYFHPSFHYADFPHSRPNPRERARQLQEKFLVARILKHPQLQILFCLDPYAVERIQSFAPGKAIFLPDPVQLNPPSPMQAQQQRQALGIEPGRMVFLLFGGLHPRKGILQVLQAVEQLPDHLCHQICLLIIGTAAADPDFQTKVEIRISAVKASRPAQILTHYNYITEAEIPLYFQPADVVLVLYQWHVGMSGVQLLAAAAKKPVLGSDYGVLGLIISRFNQGLAVDSTSPTEIAHGLTRFLTEPHENLWDQQLVWQLAQDNAVDLFAPTLFNHLLKYEDTCL